MPQTGPILLLTRPADASARFLAGLNEAGVTPSTITSPLIAIRFLAPPLPGPPVAALILTSAHGVAGARRDFAEGTRAWCVGRQTAQAARRAGFAALSADGDAEALIALILASGEAGPLLHLRGEHAQGDVAQRLSAAGIPTRDLVGYRQHAQRLNAAAVLALGGTVPVVLPLFSARTVSVLLDHGPFAAPLVVVAISPAVAGMAAPLAARRMLTAEAPDGPSMQRATIQALELSATLEAGDRGR